MYSSERLHYPEFEFSMWVLCHAFKLKVKLYPFIRMYVAYCLNGFFVCYTRTTRLAWCRECETWSTEQNRLKDQDVTTSYLRENLCPSPYRELPIESDKSPSIIIWFKVSASWKMVSKFRPTAKLLRRKAVRTFRQITWIRSSIWTSRFSDRPTNLWANRVLSEPWW